MAAAKKIAILGGGLAGMAAAVRLLKETAGRAEVHLFEQSRFLGGRLASFREPRTGLLLDGVQHVSMKCCDAVMRFLAETELTDAGIFQREMVFGTPAKNGGLTFSVMRNSRILPAPLHLLGSVLRMRFLPFHRRLELITLMRRMQSRHGKQGRDATFAGWLDALGCSDTLRRLFWDTLVLSAFSDLAQNVSAALADTVFSRALLARPDAWHVWLPERPLREIFHDGVLRFLRRFPDFHFHPRWQVTEVAPDADSGRFTLRFRVPDEPGGLVTRTDFDVCVLAVPWHVAGRVMPELVRREVMKPEVFEPRTISAVHAWVDRPLFAPWRSVALPGKVTQWIFRHERADTDFTDVPGAAKENTRGFYHQLMLSDAEACCSSRPEILERVMTAEVAELFPAARLLHAKTVSVPASVFSPGVETEKNRPGAQTPWPNIFLAGDWTDTGLPATLESAVVSGEAAAREVLHSISRTSAASAL